MRKRLLPVLLFPAADNGASGGDGSASSPFPAGIAGILSSSGVIDARGDDAAAVNTLTSIAQSLAPPGDAGAPSPASDHTFALGTELLSDSGKVVGKLVALAPAAPYRAGGGVERGALPFRRVLQTRSPRLHHHHHAPPVSRFSAIRTPLSLRSSQHRHCATTHRRGLRRGGSLHFCAVGLGERGEHG